MARKSNTQAQELPREAPVQEPAVEPENQIPAAPESEPENQAPEMPGQEPAENTGDEKAAQAAAPAPESEPVQAPIAPSRYIVKTPFRDRNNWAKEYRAGTDVSHFDKDRLEHLVNTGIVEAK